MSDNDPQLAEKKRARRRLVGAAALFIAAAVVLPMVMDQEPRPLTEDIQIRIPSQEASAGGARALAAKPEAASATQVVPQEVDSGSVTADAGPKASAAPALPAKVEAKPASKAEVKVEAKAEPKPAKPEAKPEAKPAPKAEPKPESKPEPKPEAKSEPRAAKPDAADVDKPADKPATKSDEQFVVQLGSFNDADNARRVRDRVKALGLPCYTETLKTDIGEKVRVRAGPFADRAAAERARAKLAAATLTGVVVSR